MKNFINTAKIEYLDGEIIRTLYSNSVTIPFLYPHQYISGEVFCRKGCRKWSVYIKEKISGREIFRLNGYTGKGFYCRIKSDRQYFIIFEGDENSTMRLYNIPDCTTVCH